MASMNDDIKRKIDFEKQQMEREIKEVENRNPSKPDEPSFGGAVLSGLKVFGISLIIGIVLIWIPVLAALVLTFGLLASIFVIWASYSSECDALKKWENETSQYQKQADIAKIKRKYEARISNLEEYGTEKGNYSYWHHPPKVCLHCGSTNVELDTWQDSYRLHREANLICKDCGWKEFYW